MILDQSKWTAISNVATNLRKNHNILMNFSPFEIIFVAFVHILLLTKKLIVKSIDRKLEKEVK